jgi:hypothetical protein
MGHKQYLVLKMGERRDFTPLAGLFPLEMAERFVAQLRQAQPEVKFLIQEVGNA